MKATCAAPPHTATLNIYCHAQDASRRVRMPLSGSDLASKSDTSYLSSASHSTSACLRSISALNVISGLTLHQSYSVSSSFSVCNSITAASLSADNRPQLTTAGDVLVARSLLFHDVCLHWQLSKLLHLLSLTAKSVASKTNTLSLRLLISNYIYADLPDVTPDVIVIAATKSSTVAEKPRMTPNPRVTTSVYDIPSWFEQCRTCSDMSACHW